MGSDDLETFNAALNFYQGGDYSQLQQTFEWSNRTIWVILDICIIGLTDIFIDNQSLGSVSQFLSGYFMTLSAFLGYFLIFQYISKLEGFRTGICATSILIFCSPILTLATGDGIESLIFLLIICIFIKLGNNNIYSYVLFLIKFYLAPLIISIEYINNNIKKIGIYVMSFILIIVLKYYLIQDNQNSYSSRIVTIPEYFENLHNILFSPGAGFIFIWPMYIICIFLGFGRYTIIKLINIFFLLLFFSLFSFWHGQGPGTRYIIPMMIIFIPEIIVAVKKIKYLKIIFLIYAILNISTLDYRNTSIYEYRNDSALIQKAFGVNDFNIKFYEFSKLDFNPLIFANQILVYKLFKLDCKKIYVASDCEKIYPRTLISRISYSLDRNLPYTNFIKNKILIKVVKFLNIIVYFIIYVIVFYSFMVSFKEEKVLNNYTH